MYYRNWAQINAKRKNRWEAMDEQGKIHMLEETELNKKAKILKEMMEEKDGIITIYIKDVSFQHASIMRVLEWGFDIKWGIKVKIKKFPGIRFDKLDDCAPILEDKVIARKLGHENKEHTAIESSIEFLKSKSPEAAQALAEVLAAKKGTK